MKRLFRRSVVHGDVSSFTGLGHPRFGGRFCVELYPRQYDEFFEQLQRITCSPGAQAPPINECAWWALLTFDVDCEPFPHPDPDAPRRRKENVLELTRLFVQELEMHFTGFEHASAVVVRSLAQRYRIYFQGVPYIGMSNVDRLMRLVKNKIYNDDHLKALFDAIDLGPTRQRHLRVHGTIGYDQKNEVEKPQSKYEVVGIVRDSKGTVPRTSRLSIRPDAEAYAKMLLQPENAYLRCCSTFVRRPAREYENECIWSVDLLRVLFNIPEDDDDDSNDSVFGSSRSNDRSEAMALLVSATIVVAEYNGLRCLLTSHGYRAKTGTAYYADGTAKVLANLDAVQLPEPVDANDPQLLTGVPVASFTEQLRAPHIANMSVFPLSLFCYSRGLSPVQSSFDSDEARVTYRYEATAERQVTVEHDTCLVARMLADACDVVLPEEFDVTAHRTITDDPSIERFSHAFPVERAARVQCAPQGTVVFEIIAGCGVGKTVFALQLIRKFIDRHVGDVLCVAPRAQLCSQLAAKFSSDASLDCHLYSDGEWPAEKSACVVTVDSLVKCVAPNGVSRQPYIVLLDEIELIVRHIATSETLSTTPTHRLRTLETLLILLANARYVIVMDAHLGFATSMLLAMVVLKRHTLLDYRPLHFERYELVDNRVRQHYCVLADDYRRYAVIAESLRAGKKVIVFESSPRKALALHALLESHILPDQQSLIIYGKTSADTKQQFASNPSEYLRVNKVQLLVHTSSIGVGVSIDDPHFDIAHVAFRPHMTDQAAVQGSHRARLLNSQQDDDDDAEDEQQHNVPSTVREVYVLFDKRMRFSEHQLQSIRTVGDAVASFERRLSLSRDLYRRYADFSRVSEFDARVVVRRTDPNTLFIASMLESQEMSVNLQGPIVATRIVDDAVTMHWDGVNSSADELRIISDVERAVEFDVVVLPTDSNRTRSQKTQLARAIGYVYEEGLASKQFMGRLVFAMSHPSNLRRFASLLVLMLVDDVALNEHVQRVLENVTETMPLYAQDDARGVTLGVESIAVAACLRAFGVDSAVDMTQPTVLPRSPDWKLEVKNFHGANVTFEEFFDTVQRRFRGPRWAKYKTSKSKSNHVRRFINCFFGGNVIDTRTCAWDARQVALSAELVPGYCRANAIEAPSAVMQWCEQFAGSWSRFIDAEKRGVHQKDVY